MTKVRVHRPADAKAAEALLTLLAEAECQVVEADDATSPAPLTTAPVEDAYHNDAAEFCPPPLVVLLPSDGTADAAFDEAVLRAVQDGCRVIGIWPSDGSGGVPACFDDFGGDTVPWAPDKLRQSVAGKPQHRTATGELAETPDTDRHVCK